MSDKIRIVFKKIINDLEKDLVSYRESLNEKSIWLFLATMGLWSISNKYVLLFAIAAIYFIFIYSLVRNKQFYLMDVRIKNIKDDMRLIGIDESDKAYFDGVLNNMLENKVSIKGTLYYSPVFLISMVFLFITSATILDSIK